MITREVKQSPVFAEFTANEQSYHFDLRKEGVTSHVDTLYYSVFIYHDSNECSEEVQHFLEDLKIARSQKVASYNMEVDFHGLSVENIRFSCYEYCLRLNENFDIFISSYLPNDSTPRIVVQLRTRSLVLDGTCQSICKSFSKLESILSFYGIEVDFCQENRLDFSYHTNIIQNPYSFFNDDMLVKKMKTKIRLYTKVGNIGKKIDIDYLSLGSRRSNDIFIRIYNKSREVCEMAYKSFFLDKWLNDKLINNYDYYVYSKAYEMKSYITGVLIGRIDWYLEFGTNAKIKQELSDIKNSSYINSDNVDNLRSVVDKYLPPVTLIMNIEFQTKRKFYISMNDYLESFRRFVFKKENIYCFLENNELPLLRLFNIISLRSEICQYLTSKTLCFVDFKGQKDKEKFCYFWKRINECYIAEYDKRIIDIWRSHDRQVNFEKSKNRVMSSIAQFSIIRNGNSENTMSDDISDLICSLNDNDFYGFACNPDTGEIPEYNPQKYVSVKKRKERQYRGVFSDNK